MVYCAFFGFFKFIINWVVGKVVERFVGVLLGVRYFGNFFIGFSRFDFFIQFDVIVVDGQVIGYRVQFFFSIIEFVLFVYKFFIYVFIYRYFGKFDCQIYFFDFFFFCDVVFFYWGRSYFFYFFFLEFLLKDNLDQDFGEWQKDLCKGSVNSMLNVIKFEFSEYEG